MENEQSAIAFKNFELLQALVKVLEKDRPNLRNEIRDQLTGRANLFFLNGGLDENAAVCDLINSRFLTEPD